MGVSSSFLPFETEFSGRRVLITGHTGFCGGWLAVWLSEIGAKVGGLALSPNTEPSFCEALGIARRVDHHIADIRDREATARVVAELAPEVIFHLAAQPLVRESYRDPATTFATNVIGTVNLLEAARACPSVRAVLVITTDKVYKNREWLWSYRETDCLGGIDPYSASKACAEIVTASYRRAIAGGADMAIATARGGNIIGGGDWSADRLIPDFVRAVASGKPLDLRNPDAKRPWQHVLAACHGYLVLAAGLLRDSERHEGSWNLGPTSRDAISVREIVDIMSVSWRSVEIRLRPSDLYESRLLALDSTKANQELKWESPWAIGETVARTVAWYQHYYSDPGSIAGQTIAQIVDYRAGLSGN